MTEAVPITIPAGGSGHRVWRRFLRHPMAMTGAAVLTVLIVLAIAAPLVEALLGANSTLADLDYRFAPPSFEHPLGGDELGRDLLVRLLYGGRVSLAVGLVAALFAAVIGTAIGLFAGYLGGWVDAVLMRITDAVISLPLLPLLIVLVAIDLSKLGIPAGLAESQNLALYRIIFIIGLVGWPRVARLVRAEALSIREREFVRAALALGARPGWIMWRHVLPNVISPVIVATTLSVGNIILLESVLSFLGLGIQPPLASWGNMLSNAQDLIWAAPQLAIWPGMLILVTVVAFNLLGEGLRDANDPRSADRGRRV